MELTSKQRRHLRGLAHHIKPVVYIGNAGISDAVVEKTDEELDRHELIKVKVADGSPVDKTEAGDLLAARTKSVVAQTIGHTVVLFRKRKKDSQITLP